MIYSHEELLGHTRLPLTIAEIILFIIIIYLLLAVGGKWKIWLGSLLLVYWMVLVTGKFWPAPKIEVPKSPLTTKIAVREDPTRGNFVWSPEYRVGFWWHFFPVKKYLIIHNRALEEKILTPDDFVIPAPLDDRDLAWVHNRGYLLRLYLLAFTPMGFINGENPISWYIFKKLKVAWISRWRFESFRWNVSSIGQWLLIVMCTRETGLRPYFKETIRSLLSVSTRTTSIPIRKPTAITISVFPGACGWTTRTIWSISRCCRT